MTNISFEKVISLSKKYNAELDDPDYWHWMEALTQIVSTIIWAQGDPSKFSITLEYISGKETAKICQEIFKDLEIPVKIKSTGKSRVVFSIM